MKVHWTDNANTNLLDINDYISHDSPYYAKRMIDKITKRSIQIGSFPKSGRRVPEYDANDIREIIENPYRIIYKIKKSQKDVLAVVYCSRLLTDDFIEI